MAKYRSTGTVINGESGESWVYSSARYIRIVEVTGSNPVCSTKHRKTSENVGFRAFFRIFETILDEIFGKLER